MAFWGIEVKPGKPVSHCFDKVKRRLRISQATLGIGSALTKSLVQCNIGNKSPVFICALLPDKTESCHLELEFEEADDVIFSVIGPRSVYLTGYYVSNERHSALNSDTESYGEDIANTETEESGHHTDEDEYEDSFIDDGDPVVSPLSSNRVDEEMQDEKKIRESKGSKRLQRKKFRIIDSDDETASKGGEDDDNYFISSLKSRKATKDKVLEVGEEMGQAAAESNAESADCGAIGHVSKEKADSVTIWKEPNSKNLACDTSFPSAEVRPEKEMELNESRHLSKEADTFGDNSVNHCGLRVDDQIHATTAKVDDEPGRLHANKEEDKSELAPVSNKKSKRKRKEHAVADKTFEGSNGNLKKAVKEDKVLEAESEIHNKHQDLHKPIETSQKSTSNMKVDGDVPSSLPDSASSKNDQRSKKPRENDSIKEKSGGSNDSTSKRILMADQLKENVLKDDGMVSNLPAITAEDKKWIADEGTNLNFIADANQLEKPKKKKKKTKTQENKGLSENESDKPSMSCHVGTWSNGLVIEDDSMASDLPAATAEDNKLIVDEGTNFDFVAHGDQLDKPKKKKKKAKTRENEVLLENESGKPSMSCQVRTLSNGLVIEELALGEQEGKLATVGKKVKVYYTAILKESGRVFDSNVGKSPFKFRLGDEAIIGGWNIGLDGMCVGAKRRLIIPPSMGYGRQGAGENVPPNSWLVYDIELAGVR